MSQKKYRRKNKLFIAEGRKGIQELLKSGLVLHQLYTTEDSFEVPVEKVEKISASDLKKISVLKTPQIALAIFELPYPKPVSLEGLVLALDGVRDPGNLGTIIRLCDWFGIAELVCSDDTVDCYNPKVVQATMGSIARVNINYLDLPLFLAQKAKNTTLVGTFMDGANVYRENLPQSGVLVLGNEANGISEEVEKLVEKKLQIPQFGSSKNTESLNVATATAILLSEFKRR